MRDRGNLVVSNIQQQASYLADVGAADAYEVSFANTPDGYTDGLLVIFKAANTNTGASTLDVNGMGPIPLKKDVSIALSSGDITSGKIVCAIYDGTNFQITSILDDIKVPISSLLAATKTNTIDNTNYTQTWNWTTKTSGNALGLSVSGTAALSGQTVLSLSSSGANSGSNKLTYGLNVTNSKTGTGAQNYAGNFTASGAGTTYALTSTASGSSFAYGLNCFAQGAGVNVAGRFEAQSGSTNYAIQVTKGSVEIGDATTVFTGLLNMNGATSGSVTIKSQDAAGTYNFNLPTTAGNAGEVLTSAGGGSNPMTWTDLTTLPFRISSECIDLDLVGGEASIEAKQYLLLNTFAGTNQVNFPDPTSYAGQFIILKNGSGAAVTYAVNIPKNVSGTNDTQILDGYTKIYTAQYNCIADAYYWHLISRFDGTVD